MHVYRISQCKFNSDLSGAGASLSGGRWNSKGVYMLYTSLTASTALLEVVVHLSAIPKSEYCLALLDIPDDKIFELPEADLPPGWSDYPSDDRLKIIGDDFIIGNKYLGLKVPSVILNTESNLLINPKHPDFYKVKLVSSEIITIDKRIKA